MSAAYIALGANLGNREANLRMAIGAMTRLARITACSSLYETDPVPPGGPRYYNAVVAIDTGLEPLPLLRYLKTIEHDIGRRPAPTLNAPRPIDLDLLLYDDRMIMEPEITVPHPRLAGRMFVLVPLAEIAPDVTVPDSGRTVADLAAEAGAGGVTPLSGQGWDGFAGKPARRVRV
jgi:2-amino-4-hydroxy-6-hydroxymethyldihydropteridine diphosphokinase